MTIRDISSEEKTPFNSIVHHPLQSYEWGEFRSKTHVTVIRKGFFDKDTISNGFQLTIHKIPHMPFTVGYLPKGILPEKNLLQELLHIGKEEKCIFIQLEPNVEEENVDINEFLQATPFPLYSSFHPLFTKYTFVLDITPSEEDLLKNMHPKTRYNIKIAQKRGVTVVEDNSQEAFETYMKLTEETTKRQGFYAHTESFHRLQWQTFSHTVKNNELSSHLLLATYNNMPLVAWMLFVFQNTLYYPYGGSSNLHRDVMASNLMMWEAIRFGKKLGLKKFDMWGGLPLNANPQDPYYGFHRFKQGYGAKHVEFVGSFDLVINPMLYQLYKAADKTRWALLNLKR